DAVYVSEISWLPYAFRYSSKDWTKMGGGGLIVPRPRPNGVYLLARDSSFSVHAEAAKQYRDLREYVSQKIASLSKDHLPVSEQLNLKVADYAALTFSNPDKSVEIGSDLESRDVPYTTIEIYFLDR